MAKKTLVIGGCRSGKSSHALELADRTGRDGKIFVATCVPQDEEMHQRVENHQKERGAEWRTVEAPLAIAQVITDYGPQAQTILIDCLTLWTSNLLMEKSELEYIRDQADTLAAAVKKSACSIILVANEVGLGIVPDNPLARLFRDAAGMVNQIMAQACERVVMTVAGIPVTIK